MSPTPSNQWRYYELNDLTRELIPLVRYVEEIENVKRNLSAQEQICEATDYRWMADDECMRKLAEHIGRDNADKLLAFAKAAKSYASFFTDLNYTQQARLYAIWACNSLFENGYDRNEVNQLMIKTRALELWQKTLKRRANASNPEIPEVHWWEIMRDLGLDDLPPIPSGRPPKKRPSRNKSKFTWFFRDFFDEAGNPRRNETPQK
jgi:hypothetical protein